MQSQTKEEMFTVLEYYHKILQNENLKAIPDKSHFFLTRVKFLGHNIERNTITPLKSRVDAIQKLQPPTNKKKIQEFLGMLNFLGKYVYKMQIFLRPFYNILRQKNNFEWTSEHQTRFEEIKKLLTDQIPNTIPDSNQPFYAMCDASNFGIGAALLQSHSSTKKMNLISANSRLFTQAELRLSTLMRECTAIIYTLTEYEFLILGSKHPTVLFTDHKPIIFLFAQKSNPNHRVYRFQLILMKFPNLHIVWTAGKNLALPDTLSRNTPPELLTRKTTVEIPQNIKFYLAKDETSPRLEWKYAVKTDIDQSQINNLQHFPLYLDCQNNHYEVDLLGTSTFKPIPYSQWIKNNTQQKRIKHHPHKKDLFPLIEKENLTDKINLSGPQTNDTKYTKWSADVKLFPLPYNSQITTTLGMSPYEMVFNQKPRKPIMFTANSHKKAQGYCQPNKDSICYNLPLHKHDEDHFHHPQILKLAYGTHNEWILKRDKKHNEIYQKITKKLLQRQNINDQIISRFTPATDLKIGKFVLIPNFNTPKGISKKNYNSFEKDHTK